MNLADVLKIIPNNDAQRLAEFCSGTPAPAVGVVQTELYDAIDNIPAPKGFLGALGMAWVRAALKRTVDGELRRLGQSAVSQIAGGSL